MRARRGTALLATLFAVTILATVTAMASRGARSSAAVAANRRAQTVSRLMAESGVIAARAHIESVLADALTNTLRSASDSGALDLAFDALLGTASPRSEPVVHDSLDDGIFMATVVNASARLDVNNAGAEGLEALFRTTMDAGLARDLAMRLDARVRGVRVQHPFESLDEVEAFLGDEAARLLPLAEDLTVDGDGTIDRRRAPARVRAAASGTLSDRPTRLVIVARGWQRGTLLTREIQAVFAVQGTELRLVRWREASR